MPRRADGGFIDDNRVGASAVNSRVYRYKGAKKTCRFLRLLGRRCAEGYGQTYVRKLAESENMEKVPGADVNRTGDFFNHKAHWNGLKSDRSFATSWVEGTAYR